MAKTYHVKRPNTCAPNKLEKLLNDIEVAGGTVVAILPHGSIAADVNHDSRYCLIEVVYYTIS